MQKVLEYLNKIIQENDTVVVGVSGGSDSMCLLSLLLLVRKNINFKIVVCHVNHKVRVESEEEEQFVLDYCKKNNCICEVLHLDKINSNFEAEARKRRYKFFEDTINKYNAKFLFTAHHGDDLIETTLMRIIRGSNLSGYGGIEIESYRDNYRIIRPLLLVTKDTILEYINDNNIEYREDYTNACDDHFRNRIRHNILPCLKQENKNVHLKFLEYSENLFEIDKYLQKKTNNILEKIYINNVLNITEFKKLDSVIQRRVLEEILHIKYNNDLYLVTNSNTREIFKLIYSSKPNVNLTLPNNIILKKSYNSLYFYDQRILSSDKVKFEDKFERDGNYLAFVDDVSIEKSNYVLRLNSKDIKLPLYIRTRKNGDKIFVKNMKGSKKLKDVFIDEKIPSEYRNSILLVVDSDDKILWIPGIKKSKFDKEINEKYDIILKYIKKGDLYEK